MSQSSNSSSGGVGLAGLVFVVFLTLKLAEVGVVATWSWWWVCSPLWIPLALVLALVALLFVGLGIRACVRVIAEWRTRSSRLAKMMQEDE